MVKRLVRSVAFLGCLLIALGGCSRQLLLFTGAVAAAGAGTYAYVKGDLKRNYEAPMARAWTATVKAVEELKLPVESQQHDAFSGSLKGKMADGKSFAINLKRLAESSTEIGIRIGAFGDRDRSEAIHNKILSKL